MMRMDDVETGKETLGNSLLGLTAISGELPVKLLPRFPGGGQYKEKVITELKKEKLLRTFNRDRLKGYRLTGKAKEKLLRDKPERFSFYLTGSIETNAVKTELSRRLRIHRLSEVYLTALNSGIEIFRDRKPPIFTGNKGPYRIEIPVYYGSREIKEAYQESMTARGSRMAGTLLTPDTVFMVYHTGASLFKWNSKWELRARAMLSQMFRIRLPGQYSYASINALIFGDSMNPAVEIMEGAGTGSLKCRILNSGFEHFHFVTLDHAGEVLLRLLSLREKRMRLNDILSADLTPCDTNLNGVECDGADPYGRPVLIAYTFDMPMICRFAVSLIRQGKEGVIICFDYQADVIQRLFHGYVQIQAISLDKLETKFPV